MTNQDVAFYMLDNGLSGMDGCVYLDEADCKMIAVRTGRFGT
jgi:hypothetical protein